MTKEKSLYQTKLILDYLPEEEYELIPKDMIEYIEANMDIDETMIIEPNTELDKQNIDEKTYDMLEKIIKKIKSTEIDNYVSAVKKQNKEYEEKFENIKLKNIIETLKKENSKIPPIKALLEDYKKALAQYEKEIEELKSNNAILFESFNKIPSWIRNIFIKKDRLKQLNSGN